MLTSIRDRFGKPVIYFLVVFVGFVFVFWGVFNPSQQFSGGIAGSVNGEPILVSDFSRELNQRLNMYRQMNFPMDQLKNLGIHKSIFDSIVRNRLMIQMAQKEGMEPGDERIREKVRQISAFQKDGKFDVKQYEEVLKGNGYTPSRFEAMIREELMVDAWREFFQNSVRVSRLELEAEYRASEERRSVGMLVFDREYAKKKVSVDPKAVQALLDDAAKVKLLRTRYDAQKDKAYKGKSFDAVKTDLARAWVASEKSADVSQIFTDTAQSLEAEVAKIDWKSKSARSEFDAALKSKGLMSAGWKRMDAVKREELLPPGLGKVDLLTEQAFAANSEIDLTKGGKPKVYQHYSGVVVAFVDGAQPADASKLNEQERTKLLNQLAAQKRQELFSDWVKGLQDKAKVEMNEEILGIGLSS